MSDQHRQSLFGTDGVRGTANVEPMTAEIAVSEKRPIDEIPSVREMVRQVEKDLDGRGRVLVRYSGTELKARVMVEGEDESRVDEYANEIAENLRRAVGSA